MPHFVIEYSEDVAKAHDIAALCRSIFDAAITSDIFDPAAIKVRARPCPYWHTGTEPQSFAHITIRLMSGRNTQTKLGLTKKILATMDKMLPDVGSLTVDIKDIDPTTYAKRLIEPEST